MNDTSSTRKKQWLAVAGWALLLFLLSSIPGEDLDFIPPIFGWDKVGHFILYGILGVLVFRALSDRRSAFGLAVLLCVAYGLLDEIHQIFVPGRTPSIWDLTADAIGATAGIQLLLIRIRRAGQKRRDPASQAEDDRTPSQ